MTINLIFKIAAVGILLLVLFWIVPYIYDLFESIQNLFSL